MGDLFSSCPPPKLNSAPSRSPKRHWPALHAACTGPPPAATVPMARLYPPKIGMRGSTQIEVSPSTREPGGRAALGSQGTHPEQSRTAGSVLEQQQQCTATALGQICSWVWLAGPRRIKENSQIKTPHEHGQEGDGRLPRANAGCTVTGRDQVNKRCAGCHAVCYFGRRCQKQHWSAHGGNHRAYCKPAPKPAASSRGSVPSSGGCQPCRW